MITTAIPDPGADPSAERPTRTSRLLWRPAGWYSSLLGWGASRPVPRRLRSALYGAYSRMTGADLGEVEQELAAYPTLGDFFARRLRPGARGFDLPADAVASPCDGTLAALGTVGGDGTLIQAKGRTYRLDELLDEVHGGRPFAGGWYATIYLSPADYHRVHTPIGGRVVAYDHVPGSLWPVKPLFTRTVDGLLARNERAIIHLDTAIGPVAVAMVAAVGVGNIWLSHLGRIGERRERRRVELPTPMEVARGDELGAFLLGSTVVIVFPGGRVEPDPGLEVGQAMRCGQPLGRIVSAPRRSPDAGASHR